MDSGYKRSVSDAIKSLAFTNFARRGDRVETRRDSSTCSYDLQHSGSGTAAVPEQPYAAARADNS
jgi:hypothetical protein